VLFGRGSWYELRSYV